MQITGKLKIKYDEQQVSDKFCKRDFVLTDDSSQYPQFILFQLTQDRTGLINSINTGDEITVHFNLQGREWTSPQGEVKYFNTLTVWKIDVVSKAIQQPSQSQQPINSENKVDKLPF